MNRCQICGVSAGKSLHLCRRCQLSIFQVIEILEIYIKENPPPDWLVKAISELAWIFNQYPRTKGYLNTAMEVTWMFTLDGLDEVGVDDVMEVNYSNLPRDKILALLEEAMIVERKVDRLSPGPLVRRLREVRWEGYQINTAEIQEKLLEIQGVLTVALTKSLIHTRSYLPRRALAVFNLLSSNMIRSGENINPVIPEYVYDAACSGLSSRQRKHIEWIMCGLLNGHTKIFADVTEEGLAMKDVMIEYSQKMRERWRARQRERGRE